MKTLWSAAAWRRFFIQQDKALTDYYIARLRR